jgi:phosphoglycerate kinase
LYYKVLRDLNIYNKNILVRVDFNLPTINGKVADVTRVKAVIPTIDYIISNSGKPILMSHYGRPKGKHVESLSLKHMIPTLEKVLNKSIIFFNEPKKEDFKNIKQNEIVLLENLRFNPGEELNDIKFAQKLANLGDLYVNDAFSASHRSHSSTDAITKFLPSVLAFLWKPN